MDYYPPSGQKTLILTFKDILHSLYGLLLHVGEDVRVGVEGYGLSRDMIIKSIPIATRR